MRRLFSSLFILLALAASAQAQTGSSAASPTLKVTDGTKSFNGVNELRFPVGCVTFSNRTAVITCTSGGTSTGTTTSQNGNLFYASPNGSYGLPSWRAIVAADIPVLDATKIGGGSISNTEFQFLNNVNANIQTQIDGKAPTSHTHTLSQVSDAGTAAALNAPASGNAASGEVVKGNDTRLSDARTPTSHTHAESEVTNLVSDLAAKQPLDADLTAIAALSPSNDDIIQRKAGAWAHRTPAQLKTDLALVKSDVGLPNVDNTSDATKNAATATLTNKTLITPTIGDFTNAAHGHTNTAGGGTLNASALAAGTVATARLGSGTASSSTYLRGDQTFATPVTSIAGTSNQVIASASTGAVTLSLPQSICTTCSVQFGNLAVGVAPGAENLLMQQPSGTTASIARFSQIQSGNARGGYVALSGGASGDVNRGYFGFAGTGTGNTTLLTGEIVDAVLLRSEGALQFGTGGDNIRLTLDATGNAGIGTASPTAKLDINGDLLRLRVAKTPSSSSDACNAGEFAWDANYLYICPATNTWRRVAHSTW